VIFPDACGLLDFMLKEAADVLEGLRVFPDRMRRNLEADGGLAFSQSVLLALIDRGLSRDDAYAIVQRAAAAAWDEGADFRAELGQNPEVQRLLSPEELNGLFDPERFLRNLGGVFEKLEKLPVEER
jgi:adenylosuccinate lyase